MFKNNISKKKILEELFAKNRLGIKPGLERTLELSKFVDNPHLSFKSIHIAGTNGKGSVSSAIFSILMESKYKVGLYTSPHLIDFNERIRVNNKLIPDEKIIEYYKILKNKAEQISATFFEITSVMAFMYFRETYVDIAVIETGMGGRFDSTNIINPLLSIITKIDYDHQEFLGDTIEKITYEKCGIIKKNIPCIISKNSNDIYQEIFKNSENTQQLIFSDKKINLELKEINKDLVSSWEINSNFNFKEFDFPISGIYQKDNLKTVFAAIEYLSKYYKISEKSILTGFKKIINNSGLRARIELIDKKRNIILDGSHNSGGIENLFITLNIVFPDKKWNIVFATMSDKDFSNAIQLIKLNYKKLYLTNLKIPRAMQAEKLALIAEKVGIKSIEVFENIELLLNSLKNENDVLIFGSFYLAGEILEIINLKKLYQSS